MSDTPTRSRGPRRDAAENRETLLLAAATVLDRDPGASLEAVATEAGLSRRALYGHFATRDDLLRELALHGAARINAALLPAGESPAAGSDDHDPARRLAAVGARLWDEVDHVRTMALTTVRGPQAHLVGDALLPLRRHVRAIVEAGVASGDFRDDIEARTLSRLIESAAISVLDESTRHDVSSDEGRRLVVLSVLSMAGYSAADAGRILRSLPTPSPKDPR
jgi:AcrR family transcriptional regulator